MANDSQQTVPWSCHICGRVFDISYRRGVCAVCLEPTSRGHLWRTHDRDPGTGKRRLSSVCTSCRKSTSAASQPLEGQR